MNRWISIYIGQVYKALYIPMHWCFLGVPLCSRTIWQTFWYHQYTGVELLCMPFLVPSRNFCSFWNIWLSDRLRPNLFKTTYTQGRPGWLPQLSDSCYTIRVLQHISPCYPILRNTADMSTVRPIKVSSFVGKTSITSEFLLNWWGIFDDNLNFNFDQRYLH